MQLGSYDFNSEVMVSPSNISARRGGSKQSRTESCRAQPDSGVN